MDVIGLQKRQTPDSRGLDAAGGQPYAFDRWIAWSQVSRGGTNCQVPRMELLNPCGTYMNYYARHLGDYARDASHLSLAEHGAYTLLLDRYYATERPIGREEAYRICRAIGKADKQAVQRVLTEFFRWTDEGYRNKRADEEIAKMAEKRAKAQKSAKVRWDATGMRTHSERNANGMLSNNQEPITNSQSALAGYSAQPERRAFRPSTSRIGEIDLIKKIRAEGER